MRSRRVRNQNDDGDAEKYIGIECYYFLALLFFVSGVFVFCCLCDVFVI
jgi:hypothetical protein